MIKSIRTANVQPKGTLIRKKTENPINKVETTTDTMVAVVSNLAGWNFTRQI